MGFNRQEECPATRSDFLMTRPAPDYFQVDITTKDYIELTSDKEANLAALVSIVQEYARAFAEEDLIEAEIGPFFETDSGIPDHLLIWFDRKNLEKLMKGATGLAGGEFTEENIHSAHALVAAYFAYVKTGWETVLGMVVDMETNIAEVREKVEKMQTETSEPETLEELKALRGWIKTFSNASSDAQKIAEYKRAKIRTALKAQAFLSSIFQS